MTRRSEVSEAEWVGLIATLARFEDWLVFTNPAKTGDPAFPRLELVRPPKHLLVVAKTDRGTVTAPQQEWIDQLTDAGVEVRVWRPMHWSEVEQVLRQTPARETPPEQPPADTAASALGSLAPGEGGPPASDAAVTAGAGG